MIGSSELFSIILFRRFFYGFLYSLYSVKDLFDL
jgi:hypothetical protein